ncbi:MAG: alkane 1-monooxygenase [Chitinophagia bacterium]
MRWRWIKYMSPFVLFLFAFQAFSNSGWLSYIPLIFTFGCIPLAELLMKASAGNISAAEEEMLKADKGYDYLLYEIVLLQYYALLMFLFSLTEPNLDTVTRVGRIISMGLLCGIFGINVGHELGHRSNKTEQFMAKMLLLSSQYLHFFIEHNKGHHKQVATPLDPASARRGESLYTFYPRTLIGSYISAWHIAARDCQKKGVSNISWRNEMIQFTVIQVAMLSGIGYFFGPTILFSYLASALIGILLLESVNYIEHYGLQRKETTPGSYERTQPWHSWNSNHVLGRIMLFELSRHSDHHYVASRKYQLLRHMEGAPQMPTGYPGMLILAHIPPIFFRVMDRTFQKLETQQAKAATPVL